jgi:hypothetical protein
MKKQKVFASGPLDRRTCRNRRERTSGQGSKTRSGRHFLRQEALTHSPATQANCKLHSPKNESPQSNQREMEVKLEKIDMRDQNGYDRQHNPIENAPQHNKQQQVNATSIQPPNAAPYWPHPAQRLPIQIQTGR